MIGLWAWLACAPAPSPDLPLDTTSTAALTDTAVTVASTTSTSTEPTPTGPASDGLWGERLDPPIFPPVFSLLNQDGELRTHTWLLQGPTVLWFYRDAGSAG